MYLTLFPSSRRVLGIHTVRQAQWKTNDRDELFVVETETFLQTQPLSRTLCNGCLVGSSFKELRDHVNVSSWLEILFYCANCFFYDSPPLRHLKVGDFGISDSARQLLMTI